VEFRDGATVLASVTTAPYTATWNGAAAGVHNLTAWALDDEGASTTSAAIAVTVVTVTEPTTPPPNAVACAAERQTCTIPTGATATVWFGTGSTWASKSGVTGSITCANWIFGDPAPGASKSCRYVVTSGSGNQAPSVVLTSPSPNANVAQGTPIALAASASDADGSIERVEFYDGATLIATVNDAPFSVTWSGATAGVHSVSAVAYDDGGLSATSATVAVSVVPPAQPPAEAVTCAAERATCVVPAGRTATVWFGVGTSWVFKTGVSGSITCANWVFGDPLPGATKSCRML
jgi:chitinase